jgi:hypothetical protein
VSETFSESDLSPSPEERARARAAIIDRAAATLAVIAAGSIAGGMLAMGACAAPAVFGVVKDGSAGAAMASAFGRFDKIALAAACVALGAEVVRTFLARRERPTLVARARRLASFGVAGCATMLGMVLTPTISLLHESGAVRGEGELGAKLAAAHDRAETVGKVEVGLALLVIGLHVFTLRTPGRLDEEDGPEAQAPLPPGPLE